LRQINDADAKNRSEAAGVLNLTPEKSARDPKTGIDFSFLTCRRRSAPTEFELRRQADLAAASHAST